MRDVCVGRAPPRSRSQEMQSRGGDRNVGGSIGGGCHRWRGPFRPESIIRCSLLQARPQHDSQTTIPVRMMLQDLCPLRVVAVSAGHARAVVASTTHLTMAMAKPWTVRAPTHGRCRAHIVWHPRHRKSRGCELGMDDAAGFEPFQGGCSLSCPCQGHGSHHYPPTHGHG